MCKVFSYHAKAEFYLADDIAIFVSIVKSCYYTQMGCGQISLAGFPREAPTIRLMAVYFLWQAASVIPHRLHAIP